MHLAWTTVANRADAERLAREVVQAGLAVCVQIEGPILSIYRWHEALEQAEEFRLCLKCLPERLEALERRVLAGHPYEIPEWIVVPATRVGEKYLSWANANSTTSTL